MFFDASTSHLVVNYEGHISLLLLGMGLQACEGHSAVDAGSVGRQPYDTETVPSSSEMD